MLYRSKKLRLYPDQLALYIAHINYRCIILLTLITMQHMLIIYVTTYTFKPPSYF